MTNKELREFNKGRKICQIAIITWDIEKAMENWVKYLKIGPWMVLTFNEQQIDNLKVNGEIIKGNYEFKVTLADVGDIQFELVQPVSGPLAYENFFRTKGEGLHHIKEKVATNDLPKIIKAYADMGIKVAQTGLFAKIDTHVIFDSEPVLHFIYEIGNSPEFELPKDLYYIYPGEL